ncbi:restriction endonuclease [Aminipila sp.]|uniref:restriction endonuclease n=1 Tax=Aminipila sp. TaxID=2060095 RepID=UPI0028A278E4|nr:restriction endonuclease [Aminipila sp.]
MCDKDIILSYSEFSKDTTSYGINSGNKRNEIFYEKIGWCPFCNRQAMQQVSMSENYKTNFGPMRELIEQVWQCTCGWWQIYYYSHLDDGDSWKDWEIYVYNAQLKKFNIGARQVPIKILRDYLESHYDRICDINDKKMEELVAAVFREHYSCEVIEVGKSHDGGVDLLLVNSDCPTIIQVKRRRTSAKTESVKEIRDLLGATMLFGSSKCIFVTTADHFSPDAINSRNIAISKKIVDSFELYDYNSFFDLVQLHKNETIAPWVQLLRFEQDLKCKVQL